ncbi:MAG: ABC transporter permease [Patescibacteria group bacterium]|jgi:putative ABC transport system permease protein
MNILPLTKVALKSMSANKVRTFLTALGMIIGVAAVMIVFSAGEGVKQLLNAQIEAFGTNIIHTEVKAPTNKNKGNADASGGLAIAMGTQITTLSLDDLEDFKKLPNITNAYGAVLGQDLATYGSYRKKVSLLGVSPSFIDIDKSEIEAGRFFTEAEDRSLAKVAVVGYKIINDFFNGEDPLGKEIKIGKNKFQIIGTLKKRGGGLGMDYDTYAYIPVKTAQKKIIGTNYLFYAETTIKDLSQQDQTAEEMRTILRRNHDITSDIDPKTGEPTLNKDDFRVVTIDEMKGILDTVTWAITALLLGIVAISLLVGGVGIMNIMYVIVSERTREIGLRKAVGAKLNDILGQFLIESALVSLTGALLGILIGLGISWLIAIIAQSQGLDWGFAVPWQAYIVSLAFSILFGIVFGLFPARKAAKMEPITALRNE